MALQTGAGLGMLRSMPLFEASELPDPIRDTSLVAPTDARVSSDQGPHWADALWRASLYCVFPRVVALSLLPLALAGVCLGVLAWWAWGPALGVIRSGLDQWTVGHWVLDALARFGLEGLRALIAPVLLVILVVPVVLVVCLLLVASFMTPAMVSLVQARRLPGLKSMGDTPWWRSLGWSLWSTLWAVLAFVITLPLWLVPPFPLILPPLVWGWLTYRVMAFDALADWAAPEEIAILLKTYRKPLMFMGVVSGLLGAAPSALWAFGALALAFAPFVLLLSVWLYTLAFAFSSLWFAHFLLPALAQLRAVNRGPSAAQMDTPS